MAEAKVYERRRVGQLNIPRIDFAAERSLIQSQKQMANDLAAMNKFGVLSQNQVKSIVGHTQFSTTAGIYGNKLVAMSNQARSEVAAAKETATNADLISQVISKNN